MYLTVGFAVDCYRQGLPLGPNLASVAHLAEVSNVDECSTGYLEHDVEG